MLMISYSADELRRIVRWSPRASVAVGGDRYSVGYSVTREHVACDSRLRRRQIGCALHFPDHGAVVAAQLARIGQALCAVAGHCR